MQYGRQNIENVRKRNGKWTIESDESDEEEDTGGALPSSPQNNVKPSICKPDKKQQNGAIGNSVIARSKDLILVPEPEMQNHDEEEEEEANPENQPDKEKCNNKHLTTIKEVPCLTYNFYNEIIVRK